MIVEKLDCVVIGAGVVGLACAAALAAAGREVLIIEAEARFGEGISSRNSEVIHAGLYYPPGSLKGQAVHSWQGAALPLLCRALGAPRSLWQAHRRHHRGGGHAPSGNRRQCQALRSLGTRAPRGGRARCARTCAERRRCPALHLDRHHRQPRADACAARRRAILRCAAGAQNAGHRWRRGQRRAGPRTRRRRAVFGAHAHRHQRRRAGCRATGTRHSRFCAHQPARCPLRQGQLLRAAGQVAFSHLIYPLPEPGGLGVPLTLDLAGQAASAPTSNGSPNPTITSAMRKSTPSRHPSAATGRASATVAW